jgi:hypothetical protein
MRLVQLSPMVILLFLLLEFIGTTPRGNAQNVGDDCPTASANPMTTEQVAILLESGYTPEDVLTQARTRGLSGTIDAQSAARLRNAGGSAQFVLSLMGIANQTTSASARATPDPTIKQSISNLAPVRLMIRQKINGSFKYGYVDETGKVCIPPKYDRPLSSVKGTRKLNWAIIGDMSMQRVLRPRR